MFDENLPRRLTRFLGPEVQATTVGRRGWSGKKNGELLNLAEKEFEVFVTTDKGLPHQQNLANFDLALVLLRAKSNDYEDLAPLMDETNAKLAFAKSGIVTRIPSNE
ncbi:MAG: DUF5615 family PIN-like protein [Rubrobacteraceae bacterium]